MLMFKVAPLSSVLGPQYRLYSLEEKRFVRGALPEFHITGELYQEKIYAVRDTHKYTATRYRIKMYPFKLIFEVLLFVSKTVLVTIFHAKYVFRLRVSSPI